MIIAISQPTLFPWLGYFDIISKTDTFVFLDDVQINKRSWQTRNKIKNYGIGEPEIWLNIPIKKTSLNTKISDVNIDNSQDWKKKHLHTLQSCYGKKIRELEWLNDLYSKDWELLVDFNIEFIKKCCEYLEIKTKFRLSSEFNINEKRTEKLVKICQFLKADQYLTTRGAEDYLDDEIYLFERSNIKVIYHDYNHPRYEQRGEGFVSHLSILDLVLNLGDKAKNFFSRV